MAEELILPGRGACVWVVFGGGGKGEGNEGKREQGGVGVANAYLSGSNISGCPSSQFQIERYIIETIGFGLSTDPDL